jgi:hypothetical protein
MDQSIIKAANAVLIDRSGAGRPRVFVGEPASQPV